MGRHAVACLYAAPQNGGTDRKKRILDNGTEGFGAKRAKGKGFIGIVADGKDVYEVIERAIGYPDKLCDGTDE